MKPKSHPQSAAVSRFIFRGRVLGPVRGGGSRGAAIVRVEEVMEAPAILLGYNGRDVVVVPPSGVTLGAGDTHVFHGGGYEFGEGLTVEAVEVERVTAAPHVAAQTVGWDARAAAADRRMRQRVRQASAVVAGIVDSVRLPRTGMPAAAPKGAAALVPPRGPISEHDPQWREAVVKVARTHKGTAGADEVVVQFAASNDVRWFRAPKLQAGQTGVFALHPPAVEPSPAAPAPKRAAKGRAATRGPAVFCALDPADVQPLEREEDVARAASGAAEPPATGAQARRATPSTKRPTKRRRGGARPKRGGR